jgi:hypothetical protein
MNCKDELQRFYFLVQVGKGKEKNKQQKNYLENKVPLASASMRRLVPLGGIGE